MKFLRKFLSNEQGSIIVLIAFCLVVLCAFTGLVLDVGNMYLQQERVQNALDAACLAGAMELPNTSQAQSEALQYASLNGLNSAELTVQFTNNNTTISATGTRNVQFTFLRLLGFDSTTISAKAAAVGGLAQCFDYTVFSGSKTDTLTFNGNNLNVNGSAHANQNISANGNNISVTGACEAVGTVSHSGSNISIPYPYPHSSYVSMPDYSATVEQQAQSAGHVYNSSQTYNGNNINVAGSIYINGNATLNGNNISGAGAILTTGNITIDGNCINNTNNDQVCLYAGNNVTINGNNLQVNGIIYAPNGSIILNGNNITINGEVIGYKLVFNGNNITINGTSRIISLPNSSAKLTQ